MRAILFFLFVAIASARTPAERLKDERLQAVHSQIVEWKKTRASFPVDFTPDYLTAQSIDRLRHIFLAMCLHCQRLPETPASTPHAA